MFSVGSDLTSYVLLFVGVIIAMGFHEAMHAYAGHLLGDTTAQDAGRLTLNPLKHIDLMTTVLLPIVLVALRLPPFFAAKPVPFSPWRVKYGSYGAALIGIAGPLMNFVLAAISALLLRTIALDPTGLLFQFLLLFTQLNIGLFVFNMIPFPPLDGSRLVYAFAPESVQNVMYKIESFGIGAILAFMFLLYPIIGPVIVNVDRTLLRLLLGSGVF